MDALLARLQTGPLSVRPAFQQKLQSAVAGWVRSEALAQPRSSGSRMVGLRDRLGWLLGRQDSPGGVSGSTLFLGRSLAFYLGATSVICAFLLLREPAQGPEVRTNDRAHTLTVDKPRLKTPAGRPDLGGPRPK